MTSACPPWICLSASPMALVPAAQAVTVQLIGPLAPKRIETCPEARFARTAGMVKGDSFFGPPRRTASL